MRLSVEKDIEALRTVALDRIQAEAAQQRLKYISWGEGQEMEYQQTAAEAEAYQSDPNPDPANYPFLVAEQRAQGDVPTLAQIAAAVIQERAVWMDAGPKIKKARREARIAVQQATTPAEVEAAATVDWATALSSPL